MSEQTNKADRVAQARNKSKATLGTILAGPFSCVSSKKSVFWSFGCSTPAVGKS
ncbi:MAG: hypothetical protein IJB31_09205 [Akkermansia sp.]|nr:hypothetical protein [Akkermansia sp.]